MRTGNGSRRQLKPIRRSSARIMNHLQFEFGLVPTKVNKEDKAVYIQALVDSRDQDSTEPFRQFMLQEHLKNISKEIEQFKNTQGGGQKTVKVDRKLDRQYYNLSVKTAKSHPPLWRKDSE